LAGRLFLWSAGRLHWGFIVRQLGASAAQLAYPLPPPTTVAGAFMAALGRALGLREEPLYRGGVLGKPMYCALQATAAAAAGIVRGGSASYDEPARLVGAGYKGGASYLQAVKQPPYIGMQEVMPVQGVGASAAPDTVMALAWLFDPRRLAGCLGVAAGDVEAAAGEAALLVHRLGSREGFYSAVAGGVAEYEEVEGGGFKSILYQREACARPLTGGTARLQLPVPPDYRVEGHAVPTGPLGGSYIATAPASPVDFRVERGCAAARAEAGFRVGGESVRVPLGLAFPVREARGVLAWL